MKKWISILMAFILIFSMSAAAPEAGSPVSSVSHEESIEETPSITPEPTPNIEPSPEPSQTEVIPTPTITPEPSAAPTAVPEVTVSPTPKPVPTATPEVTATSSEEENTVVEDTFHASSKARAAAKSGTLCIRYNSMINGVTTGSFGGIANLPAKEMDINGKRVPAYCLNKEKASEGDIGYGSIDNIPGSAMSTMRYIAANGFRTGSLNGGNYSEETAKWLVTQLLMWTAERGNLVRHADANWTWPASVDRDFETVAANAYNPAVVRAYYAEVKRKCLNGKKIPSFSGDSVSGAVVISLDYNPSTGKWSKTLTDTNEVLDTFDFSFESNTLSVNQSGNHITITSTAALGTTVSKATSIKTGNGDSVITWRSVYGNAYFQDLVTGGSDDMVTAYIRVQADPILFNVALTKTSADVYLTNKNPNYSLAGAVYEVKNASGILKATFTTDAKGKANLSNKLTPGTYTVKEKKAPPGYVLDPTVHKLTVRNADGAIALQDDPGRILLTIKKKDMGSGNSVPAGNSSLAGAVYKVTYKINGSDISVQRTTDENGRVFFRDIPLGKITVVETKAPPGYKLDTRTHEYTITKVATQAEIELEPEDFTEQVYLNKIKIFKTAQQPDGSAVAEKGAKFEVFLKSAGTYSAAKETERDILTTDSSGYATTKLLPYGTYRIHQIAGSTGRDFAPDTDINVNQDVSVQASPFTVNLVNPLQKGNVEIIKTSTDGLNISGRTFRLTGTGTAGFPMDMTATTDSSGKAVFTGVMVGTYTVEETNCPSGYDKPANQTVTVSSKGTAKISFSNVAQMGTVNLVKTSTDGKYLSGIKFSLTGTSTTGKKVSLTATTDSTGRASFGKVPVGSYVVSELNCPVRYTKPADQNVVATKNNTVEVRFHNKLKEAQIKLVKKCTYSGGYLSGAVFRLFKSDGTDTGITITSDAAKWVYSPKVTIGDYYLLEEKAPEHYEMNPKRYNITLDETHEAKGLAVTAYDIPLSDVYPEYVVPNSDYRSGTEVIVSYKIYNNSIAEHGPDRPLKVRLTAVSKDAGGRQVTVLDKQTTVIVPYFAQNLVFWKVKIPEDSVSLKLVCTVDTPEGVVEMDESNNTEVRERIVKVVEKSETPDTVFENTPASFRKPSSSFPVPTGGAAVTPSGAWQQWVWENSGFALKSYGVTLQSQTELSPDSAAFSAKEQDDGWVLKSGYGVSFKANSKAVRYGDKLPATEDMLVLPQHGNLYVPEFQYAYVKDKYRTLVLTASDKLVLGKNSNTITADGNTENRRIHFVPLWYPDGDYTVKTYLYDCWSPAGMLNQAITVKPVQIDGNAYGDWHINNKDKP